MVPLRVEIQEIRDVNVGQTKFVFFAIVIRLTGLVVIDFDPLHFESCHAVGEFPIKLCFHINSIDGLYVLGNQGCDLFTRVVCISLLGFIEMPPQQRVSLDKEGAGRPADVVFDS